MLRVELSRRSDGSGMLRCKRADGSVTWEKRAAKQASFFAVRDLTHFAVEKELGYQQGFFGLIAAGWDIEDTKGKSARGALPAEALEVEFLSGMFNRETAPGQPLDAAEFNRHARMFAESAGRPALRKLSDDEITRVRTLRAELLQQWFGLAHEGTIELTF